MDHEHDLVLQRVVDVAPESVFKAWTTPTHLMPWFCPKPYRTIECEIDLKPGGTFFTQMVDPDGNKLPAAPGCYLDIVPDRKLVWTSALGPGYRPHDPASASWFFTAVLTFEPHAAADASTPPSRCIRTRSMPQRTRKGDSARAGAPCWISWWSTSSSCR